MIHRLCNPLLTRSFFLFGARGAGKSTLLRELLGSHDPMFIDLLNSDQLERYQRRPQLLAEELAHATKGWVIIDEVQLVPEILNVVHALIEEKKFKFALSGSSARKLKRGGANLLAGRALLNYLFPFTFRELKGKCSLESMLAWGGLPDVILNDDDQIREELLKTYVRTYLKEEVLAEQLVRNIAPFSFFLEIAAQMNGERVNFRKIAKQLNVDPKTVQTYFDIAEDTLIGFKLPAFKHSFRKQLIAAPKFYLFDTGVVRALTRSLKSELRESSFAFGKCFEHLVIAECLRLNEYGRHDYKFSYLQTKEGAEIDLVVDRPGKSLALVEIKSSRLVEDEDISKLKALADDIPKSEAFIFCREPRPRKVGKITLMPWQEGIESIGL